MPGTLTSMPKIGFPWTISGLSTPPMGWPMILKSLGSLSATVFMSGGGSFAALAASAPYFNERPLAL